MNDPLSKQPEGIRGAIYSMIGAMMPVLGVVWYVAQTDARFEGRLDELEKQQTLSRQLEDKLNDAREDTRVHFAQTDGQLSDMNAKLGAILDIMQQPDGGMQSGPVPNFRQSPSGPH